MSDTNHLYSDPAVQTNGRWNGVRLSNLDQVFPARYIHHVLCFPCDDKHRNRITAAWNGIIHCLFKIYPWLDGWIKEHPELGPGHRAIEYEPLPLDPKNRVFVTCTFTKRRYEKLKALQFNPRYLYAMGGHCTHWLGETPRFQIRERIFGVQANYLQGGLLLNLAFYSQVIDRVATGVILGKLQEAITACYYEMNFMLTPNFRGVGVIKQPVLASTWEECAARDPELQEKLTSILVLGDPTASELAEEMGDSGPESDARSWNSAEGSEPPQMTAREADEDIEADEEVEEESVEAPEEMDADGTEAASDAEEGSSIDDDSDEDDDDTYAPCRVFQFRASNLQSVRRSDGRHATAYKCLIAVLFIAIARARMNAHNVHGLDPPRCIISKSARKAMGNTAKHLGKSVMYNTFEWTKVRQLNNGKNLAKCPIVLSRVLDKVCDTIDEMEESTFPEHFLAYINHAASLLPPRLALMENFATDDTDIIFSSTERIGVLCHAIDFAIPGLGRLDCVRPAYPNDCGHVTVLPQREGIDRIEVDVGLQDSEMDYLLVEVDSWRERGWDIGVLV